ncbi:unnamed protein product [Amoebophrya sp. A25]|nr:unnamed protein product [Amoebophrya sp. A25]|eukprot:GSA25T00013330001.1
MHEKLMGQLVGYGYPGHDDGRRSPLLSCRNFFRENANGSSALTILGDVLEPFLQMPSWVAYSYIDRGMLNIAIKRPARRRPPANDLQAQHDQAMLSEHVAMLFLSFDHIDYLVWVSLRPLRMIVFFNR